MLFSIVTYHLPCCDFDVYSYVLNSSPFKIYIKSHPFFFIHNEVIFKLSIPLTIYLCSRKTSTESSVCGN